MENVNLKASPETRAQILQLIALEKLVNNKDYTIKSYLEHLVSMAAHGNFDETDKLKIDVNFQPVELRADGPSLRSVMQVDSYRLRTTVLPDAADDNERLFGQGVTQKDE
jgi:hypothetical protein